MILTKEHIGRTVYALKAPEHKRVIVGFDGPDSVIMRSVETNGCLVATYCDFMNTPEQDKFNPWILVELKQKPSDVIYSKVGCLFVPFLPNGNHLLDYINKKFDGIVDYLDEQAEKEGK